MWREEGVDILIAEEIKNIFTILTLFSEEDKKKMAATARGGKFAETRVPPKLLKEYYLKEGEEYIRKHKILDFGCGKTQVHVKALQKIGCDVVGFDLSLEDSYQNLCQKYDRVLASSVLNVQPNMECLIYTLLMMYFLVKDDGIIIASYPHYPRYMNLSTEQMVGILWRYFGIKLIYKKNCTFELKKRKDVEVI